MTVTQLWQLVSDRTLDRTAWSLARYDAEAMSTAFSERLRDEVDLATVTADLGATVRTAMSPTTMLVWLRGAGG